MCTYLSCEVKDTGTVIGGGGGGGGGGDTESIVQKQMPSDGFGEAVAVSAASSW